MVLALHFNMLCGFLNVNDRSFFEFSIKLYEHLSIVAVDVFIMISAWFLCEKESPFKIGKLIDLLLVVIFWTVVSMIIAVCLGERVSIRDCLKSIPVIINLDDIGLHCLSPPLTCARVS